jgi:hypothetical protein
MASGKSEAAEGGGSNDPLRRRRRTIVGWCTLVSVLAADGSYAALAWFDDGARETIGSVIVGTLLAIPIPALLAGLICHSMTYRSVRAADAGGLAAIIVAAAALVFAFLKLKSFGQWGDAMDGVAVVVEFLIMSVVGVLAPFLAYLMAGAPRDT